MSNKSVPGIALVGLSVAVLVSFVVGAQEKSALKAPNGVAFSEFKGYETWQTVAVSQTQDGIKSILGNPTMIGAYQKGIPGNGDLFPDGSVVVKIEWTKKQNPVSPYFVEVPETLKSVSFIEKDSKRFRDTSGWGYAQFLYDAASDTFKPYGNDSSFAKKVCYQCHTLVKERDYIFTNYANR